MNRLITMLSAGVAAVMLSGGAWAAEWYPRAAGSGGPRDRPVRDPPRGRVPARAATLLRVRTAINLLKREVSSAEWDIVPFDTDKNYNEKLAISIKSLFDRPNARNDSFRGFLEPVIEDLSSSMPDASRRCAHSWVKRSSSGRSMAARSG